MKAVKIILAGGAAIAALASAAPASAQYYPGYGYGYGGNPVGQVINQVFGGGGYGGGYNQQAAVNQCAAAVQQRLSGGYSGRYGYAGGYNNGYAYGGGRVLGISRVEPRSNGLVVRGVATTANNATYGYNGYNAQVAVDLTWSCRTDYRGYVANVDIHPAQRNWGQSYGGYTPSNNYSNDYSQYGYRRY
jgi:hypothetical protein